MNQPLRIAFYSHAFYPNVGGIEAVSVMLATEFCRLGHLVKVVTPVPADATGDAHFPFPVIRCPTPAQLWREVRDCEVYFHNNISLPALWPLFLTRRPWVVAHHTWIRAVNGRVNIPARLKLLATRLAAASIPVSQAISRQFSTSQEVIGAPYNAALFRPIEGIARDRDLIFVGRLVSDKGCKDLLNALALLQKKNVFPNLTIIGDGPDRVFLEEKTQSLSLTNQVQFLGVKKGEELVRLLNSHRVMVVPSRWEEPYGIVALEGLACGCKVVGSERGGLADAMGPGGIHFPNGDVPALAVALEKSLSAECISDPETVRQHLSRQTPAAVAEAYLEIFKRVARKR